jgi:glycosyltransferase involved in cell wall biosynthesis
VADVVFAIPGDIDTPTGGYAYARHVLARLPGLGLGVRHLALPAGYPAPSKDDLAGTAAAFASVPPDAVLLIDGLAYGAMPASLIAAVRSPIIALVHHPLAYETGVTPERAKALVASETAALAYARRTIATSPLTARLLAAEFGVAADTVVVAEPGTDRKSRARGTGRPLRMLAVGAVSPRKGYEILIEALKPLTDSDWRLTIAGATDRNPAATDVVRAAIRKAGLGDRIRLAGAVSDTALDELYGAADLFVMPSLFEGYGMVLAEAMARGLPIVCTTGGAAAETVPDAAALKVPPGSAAGLSAALGTALDDSALRHQLANASWQTGQALPRWDDTARRIAAVIAEVAPKEVAP